MECVKCILSAGSYAVSVSRVNYSLHSFILCINTFTVMDILSNWSILIAKPHGVLIDGYIIVYTYFLYVLMPCLISRPLSRISPEVYI